MFELDFAFFNLKNIDKKGLTGKKFFLDRLAPIFFSPRLEKLIDLQEIDSKGCSILLPLSPRNLNIMAPEKQEMMFKKAVAIAESCGLNMMAVDRRLSGFKRKLLELSGGFSPVFGDNFLKALAFVLVRESLSRKNIKKLVIAGVTDYFTDFVEEIAGFGVPVSLQSYNPARSELVAYRLLYEKGQAVSINYLDPKNWDEDDLVLVFGLDAQHLKIAVPGAFCFVFGDFSHLTVPELEESFRKNGLDSQMYSLAPVMEACLLSKAGFLMPDIELDIAQKGEGKKFLILQEIGHKLDLWALFLDKGMRGLYNHKENQERIENRKEV